MRARHFLAERCTYTFFRYPWITTILCATCIGFHYVDDIGFEMSYARDHCAPVAAPKSENCEAFHYWYTPATHYIAHVSDGHLWQNIFILAIAGTILELTESSARMLLTVFVSGPIAAAGHGLFYPNRVRGVSGVVYAVIVYQIALVCKNFREMQFRTDGSIYIMYRAALSAAPTRLLIGALLLLAEIVVSATSSNVSHAAHVAGGIAGFFCGLAFGSNVVIDPLEFIIPFVGVIGLFGLILGILSQQIYAALGMVCGSALGFSYLQRNCTLGHKMENRILHVYPKFLHHSRLKNSFLCLHPVNPHILKSL